ncbi:hypothetical protein Skr01_33510 [Sphaerisporangium krabiense]|nr:hypothetical protein Skr01_33510 [Sphaerisporangium krabiense]
MVVRRGPERVLRMACVSAARGGCGGVARNMEWLETVARAHVAEKLRQEVAKPEAGDAVPTRDMSADIAGLESRIAETRQAAVDGLMPMADAGEILTGLRGGSRPVREADHGSPTRPRPQADGQHPRNVNRHHPRIAESPRRSGGFLFGLDESHGPPNWARRQADGDPLADVRTWEPPRRRRAVWDEPG